VKKAKEKNRGEAPGTRGGRRAVLAGTHDPQAPGHDGKAKRKTAAPRAETRGRRDRKPTTKSARATGAKSKRKGKTKKSEAGGRR